MEVAAAASPPSFLGSLRAPFLVLPPVCVLLGAATVVHDGHPVSIVPLLLILCGALASHSAVNTLNEYHDFHSGLDRQTTRTPFSGGSGALPARPQHAGRVLALGLAAVAVTVAVGFYFIRLHGWSLLPLGLAGIVVIVAYTPLITRSVTFCLIAPGLGFGPLMVVGTHFALSGVWSPTAAVASLVPFFLVSNLLLINQFPDHQADRTVGRRHVIIVHGVAAGVRVYTAFVVLTYLSLLVGVAIGVLPSWSLLGLATAPLAARVIGGLGRHAEDIPRLVPYLGQNVLLTLATPVLVAVGLFL